jgi:hypothetical protein
MRIAVTGEIGKSHLTKEVDGSNRSSEAGGGKPIDDLLSGDSILVGRVAPEKLASILLRECADSPGGVNPAVETADEKCRRPGSVFDEAPLRRIESRSPCGGEKEGLVLRELGKLRGIEFEEVPVPAHGDRHAHHPSGQLILHPRQANPIDRGNVAGRGGKELRKVDLAPIVDCKLRIDLARRLIAFRDHLDIPHEISANSQEERELVVRRSLGGKAESRQTPPLREQAGKEGGKSTGHMCDDGFIRKGESRRDGVPPQSQIGRIVGEANSMAETIEGRNGHAISVNPGSLHRAEIVERSHRPDSCSS